MLRIPTAPLLLCLLALPAAAAHAQTSPSSFAPAPAVEELVSRFEGDFTRVAQAMPADKYNFTPESLNIPGAQFHGVRNFAEQVRHIATANFYIAASITRTQPDPAVKTVPDLKTKPEILAALAQSFADVHKSIATITPANQNDAVDDVGVGHSQTKASLAAWVAVHGYDHYGQLVEYLRLNGITLGTPPAK